MLAKIKDALFPCQKKMEQLNAEHSLALAENQEAHKRFMSVCGCNTFPPLQEGRIVNPR